MLNLPAQLRPLTWNNYLGHELEKKIVQKWIANAPEGLPQALFISGHTGVGKTALILLMLRSLRCLNRKKGEVDPCGICPACLETELRDADRVNSNIHWIQPGGYQEGTLDAAVKDALRAAERGPITTGNPHRDILFLVFDEWHKFSSNLRQQVLLKCEIQAKHSNTMFIFVTMAEEELPTKDRDALIARCNRLALLPFSETELTLFLTTNFKDLSEPVAALIAKKSRGSLRLAQSNYQLCKQVSDLIEREVIDFEVVGHALKCSTPKERKVLWELLESGSYSNISSYVQNLTAKVSNEDLARQLFEDLLLVLDQEETEERYFACELLLRYITKNSHLPIVVFLLQLKGKKIMNLEVLEKQLDESLYAKLIKFS